MDDIIAYRLPVGRGIALILAVEVELAQLQRILAQLARDIVDDVFDRDRALWSTKAAEGGI